jgi:hypothetical protein
MIKVVPNMSENNKENNETGKLDAELNNVITNLTSSLLKKQETKAQPADMSALLNNIDLNSIMSKMTNLLIDDSLKNSFKGLNIPAPAAAESGEATPEQPPQQPEKVADPSLSEKLDKILSEISDIKDELANLRKKQKSIIELFENMGWGRRKKN